MRLRAEREQEGEGERRIPTRVSYSLVPRPHPARVSLGSGEVSYRVLSWGGGGNRTVAG